MTLEPKGGGDTLVRKWKQNPVARTRATKLESVIFCYRMAGGIERRTRQVEAEGEEHESPGRRRLVLMYSLVGAYQIPSITQETIQHLYCTVMARK